MKKVLVIGPNNIGDYLFSTPAIQCIKKNLPESSITYFAQKRGVDRLIESNPDIDRFMGYDPRHFFTLLQKFLCLFFIRRARFDIAFVFSTGLVRGYIPYITGIKERVGYYTPKRKKHRWLFTFGPTQPNLKKTHAAVVNLNLVNDYFKSSWHPDSYVVSLPSEAEMFGASFFADNFAGCYPVVCLNCGPLHQGKTWPPEYFGKFGNLLIQQFPECRLILTGTQKETCVAEGIMKHLSSKPYVLTGKTDILQLASLLKRCHLVLSSDSGTMHLACALGIPVVALFGITLPERYGPFGNGKHLSIRKKDMREIIPQNVFAEALKILSKEYILKE